MFERAGRRALALAFLASLVALASCEAPTAVTEGGELPKPQQNATASAVEDLPPWLRDDLAATDEIQPSQGAANGTAPASLPAGVKLGEAKVVFTDVVVYPDGRTQRGQVGVKNIGKAPIDMSGWTLSNGKGSYTFGQRWPSKFCKLNTFIPEGGITAYLTDTGKEGQCALNFTLTRGQELTLKDAEGEIKANLKLDFGSGKHVFGPDGTYWRLGNVRDKTAMEVMDSLGEFSIFGKILRKFDYDRALAGLGRRQWQACGTSSAWPYYYGCETRHDEEYDVYYKNGPFSVMAPTDKAMKKYLKELGGTYAPALTVDEFLELDEGNMARELALYHIVKGSEFLSTALPKNDTLPYGHYPTHRNSSEVVAFKGSHGRLWIHEDCVESFSPDIHGCKQQVAWGKCDEDWVQDEGLFSHRALGYCEVTCGRCKCTPESCHQVAIPDIRTKNAVIHVIDHVLELPPLFTVYEAPEPEPEPEPAPSSLLGRFPSLTDMNSIPGTAYQPDDTLETLIELYLANRRMGRAGVSGSP